MCWKETPHHLPLTMAVDQGRWPRPLTVIVAHVAPHAHGLGIIPWTVLPQCIKSNQVVILNDIERTDDGCRESDSYLEWHSLLEYHGVQKSPHRTNKLDANLAIVVQLLNVVLDVPNIFCKINTIRESDITHLKSVSYSIIRVPLCIFRRKFWHVICQLGQYMVANARSADRI